MATLIGIDVGTTAVKATLFDHGGTALKSYSSPYPTVRRAPNIVEQDPADWMRHVLAALSSLSDGAVDLAGIGLTSQVNSHVFVDADGRPLLPAIIWQDGRCAEVAAEIDALVSAEDKIRWWGAPLPIDASHVLSRIAYVQRHHGDVWARTHRVLAPKDYCILQLTGSVVADPMASFGVIDQSLTYIEELIALVPGARERLAPLRGISAVVGAVRTGLPGAGVPVVTGTMDAWSGLFGCGVLGQGEAMYLSGTSEILGIVSEQKVPTPGVIAFPPCEGIVLHAGPTQSGGASVAWLSQLLGRSAAEISQLAGTVDRSRQGAIFLPHLQGERAPIWDIGARGSFAGLLSGMGPADLAAAVLEGVGYSVRWLLGSLEQSSACKPALLTHAGGGARSDIWSQIRADILGRPIRRLRNLDAGVLGAALLAGVGSGTFPSLNDAARSLVVTDRIFEPDMSLKARYDDGFALYQLLYDQLKPVNARFSR